MRIVRRRLFGMLLALIMVISLLPAAAFAVDYEAEVNGEKFTALANAVNAASAGDVVKLLDDVTLSGLTISNGIILDLNSRTINTQGPTITISSSATIKNGTITGNSAYSPVVRLQGKVTVYMSEVNIESSGQSALQVGSSFVSTKTSLNADKCTIKYTGDSATGQNGALNICTGSIGSVTFDSCEVSTTGTGSSFALKIDNASYGQDEDAVISFSDSTISASSAVAINITNVGDKAEIILGSGNKVSGDVNVSASGKSALGITGGYYTANISDYVSNGYKCVASEIEEFNYKVVSDSSATGFYTVDSSDMRKYYNSLEAAVGANSGTVYIGVDYALTRNDLSVINTNAAVISTNQATLTYDGTIAELMAEIPDAAFEDASLKTRDVEMTEVTSDGGKLIAGSCGSLAECAACEGILADGYLFDGDAGNSESRFSIGRVNAVASIGCVGYKSIKVAIAVASSTEGNETITMHQSLTDDIQVQDIYDGACFTIDMKGQNLDGYFAVFADNSDITLKNGTIIDDSGSAVSTNGALKNVNLKLENMILIENDANGAAAYLAAGGTYVINGGSCTGATGVQICAGSLTIDGAQITASGDDNSEGKSGTGLIPDGAAVSAVNREGYASTPSVTILSGEFNAKEGVGSVKAYEWKDDAAVSWPDAAKSVSVEGGTYSTSVFEFASKPYEVNNDGEYSYYATASDAIQAAGSSGVITAGDKAESSITAPARDGATITVTEDTTVIAPDGYYLTSEKDGNGNVVYTIHKYADIAVPDMHTITVMDPADGSLKVSPANGSAGTVITVTATPDEGYELAYITVDGKPIRGNTFVMPDYAVTVSAVFQRIGAGLPFTDVTAGDWFYDEVAYVYAEGLMEGVSDTSFAPDATMSRAMVWTILARIDGQTITGAAWADSARTWALAEGVSDGTDPSGNITREQFVTMLWRYAGEPASSYSLEVFTDAEGVSDWAAAAMAWAVENGIIDGVSDTAIAPQATATRAQCAAMLMRFVASI